MTTEQERIEAEKLRKAKYDKITTLPERAALEQLRPLMTEKQFQYFFLHAQGMSGVEIARIFAVSPSVVSRGISRAKKNLAAAKAAGYVFNQAAMSARTS